MRSAKRPVTISMLSSAKRALIMKVLPVFHKTALIGFWALFSFSQTDALSQSEPNATAELPPLVVTARGGFAELWSSSPWSTKRIEVNDLRRRARSMPEALVGLPSVLVQKTALGQSSPYLRGLTGYHNVLLVDGIRLNHSAMRSGPNQYWSTVELLGADRIEVVRGPNGIIYGADAIGGVVNVLTDDPGFTLQGIRKSADLFGRLSSAESSWTGQIGSQVSSPEWFAELSHTERSFGNLEGGRTVGDQIATGYDSRGTNLRVARKLEEDSRLVIGFQRVFMDDVPRTHKTIHALDWKGLSKGSELWRKLDQERRLYYARLGWENAGGVADAGSVTLSLHQHEQERNRMKTGGGEIQSFDLVDVGFTARFEADDPWGGRLAYGAETHRESLSSGAYELTTAQVFSQSLTQGPLAANADYDRFAFYLSDRFETESGWKLEPGIRYSHVDAGVNEWYKSTANGTLAEDPFDKDFDEFVGSVRISRQVHENQFLYAGISQGFRPPSLYDLTSTDETSVKETPNVKLEPENFLQAEIGIRGQNGLWDWNLATYRTWIKDMIVRSPKNSTGSTVIKSNGDGFIQGLEVQIGYSWNDFWKSDLAFSWMDGEVEQLLLDGTGSVSVDGSNYRKVDRAVDRLMPTQMNFTTRFSPPASPWWAEGSVLAIGDADKLSLRDERDISRIPANGTPGFALFGLRGGRSIGEHTSLTLAAENLGDVDYRIHGSGLNGPGRNFIFSLAHSF